MIAVESTVWNLFEHYVAKAGDRQIAATLVLAHSNLQPSGVKQSKPTPVDTNELLPLAQLAKRLPAIKGAKPPSRNTLYTWATKGLKSRSGHPIKLDSQFVGGVLCATLDDVKRFSERKDDVAWKPPQSFTTQRELDDIAKRGKAAIERMRAKGI